MSIAAPSRQSEKGFTLVELAIVIIIAGLLIGLFGNFLVNFSVNAKNANAQSDLELINEALETYLRTNGRYPCPAAANQAESSAPGFGREATTVDSTDPIDTCSDVTAGNANTVGLQFATGVGGGGVVIGALPVRAINIPDEFLLDPWGIRYTYAVAAAQATPGQFSNEDGGAITIEDPFGNSLITPDDSGSVIVVSHGPNRSGGLTLVGTSATDCVAADPEGENCNGDATFVNTLLQSNVQGQNFDDLLVFSAGSFVEPGIPTGVVLPFVGGCPATGGWQFFAPAAGRSIIGAGTLTSDLTNFGSPGVIGSIPGANPQNDATNPNGALTFAQVQNFTRTYETNNPADPLVTFGGNVHRAGVPTTPAGAIFYENRDPYVVLTFCEKI